MLGYFEATPLSRAFFCASIPIWLGGSPGEPISRWMNFCPVIFSSSSAIATVWRIVASPALAICISFSTSATVFFSKGIFIGTWGLFADMFVSHLQSGSEGLQVHLNDFFALLSEYRADTILYLLHLNAEER